ncbi:MAG: LptA/OstA family protein [Treponema sp.]
MKRYSAARFLIICTSILMQSALFGKTVNITFSADKLYGSGVKGKTSTTLIGNAKVSVDSLSIQGEKIELSGKDYRYIKAAGAVTGEDTEKGFTFSAAALEFDREKEIAEFTGDAKINDTKNKVETAADRIQYNQKNETILLQMNVTLKSKDIAANALFALYYRSTSLLELTGKPVVKKGKDEFKAARISVNLDTDDIRLEGKVSGSVTDESKPDNKQQTAEPPKSPVKKEEE